MNSDQGELIGVRSKEKVSEPDLGVRQSCIFTTKEKRLDLSGLCMDSDYIVHFDGKIRQVAPTGSGLIEVDSHLAEGEALREMAGNSD